MRDVRCAMPLRMEDVPFGTEHGAVTGPDEPARCVYEYCFDALGFSVQVGALWSIGDWWLRTVIPAACSWP